MKKGFGIRRRWLTRFLLPVTGIAVLLGIIVVLAAAAISVTGLRSSLESMVSANTALFEEYTDASEDSFYSSVYNYTQSFENKNSLLIEFLNPDGAVVSSSFGLVAGSNPGTADVTGVLENQEITVYQGKDPATGKHIIAVSGPVTWSDGQTVGVLRIVTSMHRVHLRVWLWALGTLGAVLLIVLIQLLTGLWFLRTAVAPVKEMTEVSERIAAGGYGVQIQREFTGQNDEIGQLTRTINNLSLQISQTEKLQSEFLSSCSHELRTPLTAISGWAETLLNSDELDPVFIRRGMGTILNEAKRLTSLVMELLEFSRIQDGRFKLNVEDCDLRSVFEDTIFMYGSQLSKQGITLNYDYNDDDVPEIRCDPERMKQVFLNILDNAAKYGKDGGRIDCSMEADDENLTICIRDYGQGIPEDELPLVKKKFYKGSAGTRGNGIGLAVCEEIVTVHGGELIIANADDGTTGCVVTIILPYK